jgi:hypothetical protein
MRKLILVIALMPLAACKKEEPQPTPNPPCLCQKQYQVNNGSGWQDQNMTGFEEQHCSVNGDIVYIDTNYRYYWICQ